jgi:hypothetical protein
MANDLTLGIAGEAGKMAKVTEVSGTEHGWVTIYLQDKREIELSAQTVEAILATPFWNEFTAKTRETQGAKEGSLLVLNRGIHLRFRNPS